MLRDLEGSTQSASTSTAAPSCSATLGCSGARITATTGVVPRDVLGSITRTFCLGTCPVYSVTIYRDGRVEYDGQRYVGNKGKPHHRPAAFRRAMSGEGTCGGSGGGAGARAR